MQNKDLHQEFVYDFDVDGGAIGNISLGTLPEGMVVTDAFVTVETALTSGGAATVAFGNANDRDQFITAKAKTTVDTAGKVVGGACAVLAQNLVANEKTVSITIADAAVTAGKLRLAVRGYVPASYAPTQFDGN